MYENDGAYSNHVAVEIRKNRNYMYNNKFFRAVVVSRSLPF